jgi:hypothetical protein
MTTTKTRPQAIAGQGTLHIERGRERGRAHTVGYASTRIGRHPQCDCVISDPAISGLHATLSFDGVSHVLSDAGSAGGTWVNSQRISGPTILCDGDTIRLSQNVTLRYERAASPSAINSQEHRPSAGLRELVASKRVRWGVGLTLYLTVLGVLFTTCNGTSTSRRWLSPAQAEQLVEETLHVIAREPTGTASDTPAHIPELITAHVESARQLERVTAQDPAALARMVQTYALVQHLCSSLLSLQRPSTPPPTGQIRLLCAQSRQELRSAQAHLRSRLHELLSQAWGAESRNDMLAAAAAYWRMTAMIPWPEAPLYKFAVLCRQQWHTRLRAQQKGAQR